MNSFIKFVFKFLAIQSIIGTIGLYLGFKWYWVFLPIEVVLTLVIGLAVWIGIYWIITYKKQNINYGNSQHRGNLDY